MKINLKKKLAIPVDDEYLKAQGKLLKSIMYPEDDDCELGNINEEPNYRPDDEPDDNYDDWKESKASEADWMEKDPMDLATDKFINEHMKGEH